MISTIEYTTDKLASNVMPQYVNMEAEQIREATANGRSALVNVCMNLTSDFNKSSVIRNANAFLCKETILVGRRNYRRTGTTGAHHFEVIKHAETLEEVVNYLHADGYKVYAVDNTPGFDPVPLYDIDFPVKTAFVYGEEQAGLSAESVSLCDGMVFIPQRGVVRSINVSSASAVMMSEYTRQHRY